ncbi:MAG: metallophosphoesterase [Nitrospirota bacterium]|nr:metallophosphoesterase [Nitrospirota bacterium]
MNRREFIRNLTIAGAAAATPLLGDRFIPFAEAADIPTFSFAHITDLHLDVKGVSNWQHREKSVPLFIDTLRQLGRLPQLKFVIFGGDQIHAGPHDRESLYVFNEWSKQLAVPYYILLGNMEVSPVAGVSTLTTEDYLSAWRGRGVAPGRTSWTADPVSTVRVIGFDVTVEGRPYGEAGPERLAWLRKQLRAAKKKKLVILATHQLLLPTTPRDTMPEWSLWMVRNHAVVRELLEQHPNVRLVVSGHHHATKVDTVNGVTYAADPSTVTYPCAFRLFSVTPQGIAIRSVGLDERAAVSKARELLLADPYARLYDPQQPENVLSYSIGLTEQDRESLIPL